MGLLDFLFSNVVTKNQKKTQRNNSDMATSNHENYYHGYEDGYNDCCSDHDNSFEDYHGEGYCQHEDYENDDYNDCDGNECDW